MGGRTLHGAGVLILAATLSGCAATRVVRVEVPVPVPCRVPELPPRPVLPELKATDTQAQRETAKLTALGDALGWGLHLEALLKSMSPSPTPGPAAAGCPPAIRDVSAVPRR